MYRRALALAVVPFVIPFVASAASQVYSSPGVYQYDVPQNASSITVEVWGGGGGGSGGAFTTSYGGGGGGYSKKILTPADLPATVTVTVGAGGNGGASSAYTSGCYGYGGGSAGTAGGSSSFGSFVTANGGAGGGGSSWAFWPHGPAGAGGSGTTESGGLGGGGDVTITQYDGDGNPYDTTQTQSTPGSSRVCAGAGGGAAQYNGCNLSDDQCYAVTGQVSSSPGGVSQCGGNGGHGGSSYPGGGPGFAGSVPGGAGGGGGAPHSNNCSYSVGGRGGDGAPGLVKVSVAAAAPTCTISFTPNPMTGSSSTIHWSSTDATLLYIDGVGYVGASGTATVYSPGNYSGTVTGDGGTATCAATLGGGANLCSANGGSAGGGTENGPHTSTFDTPGTYTFTVPDGVTSLNYLVVGGGGGGGGDVGYEWVCGFAGFACGLPRGMGGGGGGGVRMGSLAVTPGQQLTVTVGSGGSGGIGGLNRNPSGGVKGGTGQASSLAAIVAHGGGGGGSSDGANAGGDGASGGGGAGSGTAPNSGTGGNGYAGGTGISGEGYAGGSGSDGMGSGGGGGGAGGIGASAHSTDGSGATGGPGTVSTITGSSVMYGCGGGGGAGASGGCASAGKGGTIQSVNGSDGLNGSGSGGGGSAVVTNSGPAYGGHGGSGIVVVAWTGLLATGGNGGGGSSGAGGFTCGTDGNLHDSCGNTTTCQYGCSTTTNACKQRQACVTYRVCDVTGTKVVNSCDGSVLENCATRGAGYACVAGACVQPPIGFQSFSATRGTQSFTATGHLQVSPSLVRPGDRTNVYWNVINAASCAVTSTGVDSWTGFFSGITGKQSGQIMQQTTFKLHCTALPGVTPAAIDESQIVNILPMFQEQ